MPRSTSTHLAYRPALDGLRGVAVVAVLVFHLWPSALPGGWLGVDLFFVLSGFLITSLLVREFARDGRLDLSRFWLARMRRLMPSLVVVLLAVAVMMALWTVPGRRAAVGTDMLATVAYVANWRLLFSDEAYFAGVGTPSPLRHAWSLGIEEQYYLVFPLLLLLCTRWVHERRHLARIMLALAACSAGLMAWLYVPGVDPTRVYYGTDTRAFELLIGAWAGAWIGPRQWGHRRPAAWVRRLEPMAWPALLAVLVAFALVHEDMPAVFRGGLVAFCFVALVPILAAASPHGNSFQRILAWEPLRRLGLISYALYLWHWPLHVYLTPDRLNLDKSLTPLVQAALALGCAALTYRYLEHPIRERGLRGLVPRRPLAGPLLSGTAAAGVVLAALLLPHTTPLVANTAETGAGGQSLHIPVRPYTPGPTTNVVLVGNSIPASLANHFPTSAYPDLMVSLGASFGCTPYDNTGELSGDSPARIPASCVTYHRDWVHEITGQDTMVYFIPQNLLYGHHSDGQTLRPGTPAHDHWVESTLAMVKRTAQQHHVKHVIYLTLACHDVPSFGTGDPDVSALDDVSKVKHLNAVVRQWTRNNGVGLIDQYALLCPHDRYSGRVNGGDLYTDALHFTGFSGPIMWSWLAPQIQRLSHP